MRIGAMTNPHRELLPQIRWIGDRGFDFVDLAVEPPMARWQDIDVEQVRSAADAAGVDLIVHTSPFLPLASAHLPVREAAADELRSCIGLAAELGSPLVTLHYLGAPRFFSRGHIVDAYARLLDTLVACDLSVRIAIENSPINHGELSLFRDFFARVPEAGLLLDVGHTHIRSGRSLAADFIDDAVVGKRLVHVHLSDNDGRDDLHLPLGAVRNGIVWPKVARRLRRAGYDGTVTLEIFSPDTDYLLTSRDKWRRFWAEAESPERG
ncbi:MAG: sugar phosphate isomerase/epimerase [Desulfobacteraceae bacterium]|nr:sugar phosphate isomerase/epimerase [Desulfobacteraceae bacterium]